MNLTETHKYLGAALKRTVQSSYIASRQENADQTFRSKAPGARRKFSTGSTTEVRSTFARTSQIVSSSRCPSDPSPRNLPCPAGRGCHHCGGPPGNLSPTEVFSGVYGIMQPEQCLAVYCPRQIQPYTFFKKQRSASVSTTEIRSFVRGLRSIELEHQLPRQLGHLC